LDKKNSKKSLRAGQKLRGLMLYLPFSSWQGSNAECLCHYSIAIAERKWQKDIIRYMRVKTTFGYV
jgi:hypothetical protein